MKINSKGEFIIKPETFNEIVEMLNSGVCIGGDHHKQWFLEQIAALLDIELEEHDEGIAP